MAGRPKKVEEVIIEGYTKENIFKKAIRLIKLVYTKQTLIELLKMFGIAYLVTFGWQQLEIILEGQIRSNHVDSIISLILIASLYGNFKIWEDKSDAKKD